MKKKIAREKKRAILNEVEVLKEYGPSILLKGVSLVSASIGTLADVAFYAKMENAAQKVDLIFIVGERITNTSGTSTGCLSGAVMLGRRGPSLINHGSSQDREPDGLEYPGGGP